MSDNIETYGQMQAFASLREPAWHQLGTVFDEEVSTSEMLELAYLNDWDVRLVEVNTPYPFYKSAFYVVRDSPFTKTPEVLGIVGERYNEFQNEELLAFGDNLLHGGGRWETAGSIKNGTVVFASLALDRETVLDPNGVADVVNNYLLLNTSHNGSISIQASITPVRVVCSNTLNMALSGVKQTFKIRHTATSTGRVAQAREALNLANTYIDAFEEEAKALFEAEVTNDLFRKIVETAYPMPDTNTKGAMTKWMNKTDLIDSIYASNTTKDIAGTAWGTFQAMSERLDWFRSPRKGDAENLFAAASGFDPVTNAEKARLLKIVKTLALV